MFRSFVVLIASSTIAVCIAADNNVKVVEEIAAKVNGDIITRGELAKKRLDIEAEAKRQGLSGARLQPAEGLQSSHATERGLWAARAPLDPVLAHDLRGGWRSLRRAPLRARDSCTRRRGLGIHALGATGHASLSQGRANFRSVEHCIGRAVRHNSGRALADSVRKPNGSLYPVRFGAPERILRLFATQNDPGNGHESAGRIMACAGRHPPAAHSAGRRVT